MIIISWCSLNGIVRTCRLNRYLKQRFSQLYAKASIPDICLIPIQANNAADGLDVSFQFNDTVTKIGRDFNMRRNDCSSADVISQSINMASDYLLHLLTNVFRCSKILSLPSSTQSLVKPSSDAKYI